MTHNNVTIREIAELAGVTVIEAQGKPVEIEMLCPVHGCGLRNTAGKRYENHLEVSHGIIIGPDGIARKAGRLVDWDEVRP